MESNDPTLYLRNELPLDRCPHCGISKPRLWVINTFDTHDFQGQRKRFWKSYGCSTCGGVVVAFSMQGDEGLVHELFPSGRLIDSSIPERARRHLKEAADTLSSPGVSIVGSAAAVDAMLKEKGYRSGSLNSRIDEAAAKHLITNDMAAWAHQVRLDANDQRHADEDAPFPESSDAQLCLDFALALGEVLFVLPARVTRGIKASASASPALTSRRKGEVRFKPGDTASVTKTITQADIEKFAELSGDRNAIHVDENYAKTTRFRSRIAHGMLTSSLISNVIGNQLPGLGSIYLSQSLRFNAPVFAGDTITARATVTAVRDDKPVVKLDTVCTNQRDEVVIRGEAAVLLD